LPERIKFYKDSTGKYFFLLILSSNNQGSITTRDILETEWDYIARLVEENMTDEQWERFENELVSMWEQTALEEQDMAYSRYLSQANYIQRATAMKESGL